MSDSGTQRVNRRKLLQAMTGVSAAAIAGCSGILGDDDDDADDEGTDPDELGEQVPPVTIEYWTDMGGATAISEDMVPIVTDNLEELGVDTDISGVGISSNLDKTYNDSREIEMSFWIHSTTVARIDPHEMTRRQAIDWAGANGLANVASYASCEASYYMLNQQAAEDEDERREMVHRAHSQVSEDLAVLPVTGAFRGGAIRTDLVEGDGIGPSSVNTRTNPYYLAYSSPIEGNVVSVNNAGDEFSTSNFFVQLVEAYNLWAHLIHSPLTRYNNEFEIENVLADSIEVEDGRRFTIELIDGATFHNGDPVTAEDVAFTFRHCFDNGGEFVAPEPREYESIEEIDDQTVEITFPEPTLVFLTRTAPLNGIVHKESWEEAYDNPVEFQWEEPWIGSGPFELTVYDQSAEIMIMEAVDDHPMIDETGADHEIEIHGFDSEEAAVSSLEAGEINTGVELAPATIDRLGDEDNFSTHVMDELYPTLLYPHMPTLPIKFWEFRDAVGKVLNRQEMNEVAFFGENQVTLNASMLTDANPWRPPDEDLYAPTDDPTGDVEAAREALSDAGWGWDDDGNLHYPPDADLDPLWPEGEVPSPPEFGCMTEDGNFDFDWEP